MCSESSYEMDDVEWWSFDMFLSLSKGVCVYCSKRYFDKTFHTIWKVMNCDLKRENIRQTLSVKFWWLDRSYIEQINIHSVIANIVNKTKINITLKLNIHCFKLSLLDATMVTCILLKFSETETEEDLIRGVVGK